MMAGKSLSLLIIALVLMSVQARRGLALGGNYQNQAYESLVNQRASGYGIRDNLNQFERGNYQLANSKYGKYFLRILIISIGFYKGGESIKR